MYYSRVLPGVSGRHSKSMYASDKRLFIYEKPEKTAVHIKLKSDWMNEVRK